MESDDFEERLDQLYSSAQSASSEGLREEALRRCEEALMLLESLGEDTDRHSYADFVMLIGDIHWGAGEYEEAYRNYNRVVQNEPERFDSRIATGVALFHLCRFGAAKAMLEMCSIDVPDDAETWYYLGLIALREEKEDLAYTFIERAQDLEEDRFNLPVDVADQEVSDMIGDMLSRVPEPLQQTLKDIPIIFETRPSDELLFSAEPPMDPTILGLFEGITLAEAADQMALFAISEIVLFRENIALIATDREILIEELWNMIRHEIGYFLSLTDEEMTERGLD